MFDFFTVTTEIKETKKQNIMNVYPSFLIKKSDDLMIRGGDFYAVWIDELGRWSTDEDDLICAIDNEVKKVSKEKEETFDGVVNPLYLRVAKSGMIDVWHKYCQKQCRDAYHALDEKLVFANDEVNKNDYSSKRLSYPLEAGEIPAYEKLISTLYDPEERAKIEWAIGAIVSGDSKKVQKFLVLYGAAGTGKSTILNIIQQLFDGYYSVFDARALGSSSNSFALEAFKTNPLVAIQHDGDLSRIEDNTRLNSIVSHEMMTVNEKFKATYSSRFQAFLFLGTNKPVKITDAKSGLIRRLIDVTPSGRKLPAREYKSVVKQIDFELGGIAKHCLDVYLDNPGRFDTYVPTSMMGATNDFYNFIEDAYFTFSADDGVSLKIAWEMYNTYCNDAKVGYPLSKRPFKEELKNYFEEYHERYTLEDGTRVRNYYKGFTTDKFEAIETDTKTEPKYKPSWISMMGNIQSIFDVLYSNCAAQYATSKETPAKKWEQVATKLSDIDSSKLHYVMVPENHIVIDFDIPDETGKKCLEKNIEEASKWPNTYAELSKSGAGVHLHYIYNGDVSKLSRVYDDHIEIKIFNGNSSLRRKVTKCNDIPIATINSGLPLKEENVMINWEGIQNEKMLRTMIKRNLNKEYHPATKPSVDYIYKLLEDAYAGDITYDVTDMRNSVLAFAASSSNQAEYCIKLVNKMQFKSDIDPIFDSNGTNDNHCTDRPIVFFDVEVFPNLFIVNWKLAGEGKPVVRMINPKPSEIEELLKFRLIGFNNRRYDNHILYARLLGYSNQKLFNLSSKIVSSKKNANRDCFFLDAYNISYTDVYDFASAGNKKNLKKFEIDLGLHHQELGLPWDKPVDESLWIKVAEYCDNDVLATEAVFNHLKGDWTARQILADLAGMSYNDTTNTLTTRIIFGSDRKPQGQFNYRDMSQPVTSLPKDVHEFLAKTCPIMMSIRHGKDQSILPYFPGYTYSFGKSIYMNEVVGEGGYVYSEPGMYGHVALLDVASMHPHSLIAECLFGVAYTTAFRDIVEGRVSIKHEAWNEVDHMLDGKLKPYIQKVKNGEMTSKDLANALKTAINSVYGLTAASFDQPFKDKRNVDNIVAKRGALFMMDLKKEVQARGFTVAHIKTDSIKIPDATPEIIQFVMEFGEQYGYTFEHEATYEKMCLVNDAVYIAKFLDKDTCKKLYGYIPGDNYEKPGTWTATGTQFAVPYLFKTLFSKEPILFEDLCETKSVTSSLYLDINEELPEDEHDYMFVGRIGSFCPIQKGKGGGLLVREKDGKYHAATGTKGYRWLESEMVKVLHKEDDIDKTYYNKLIDVAVTDISKYGDFEWFVSDEPYEGSTLQIDRTVPFD